MLQSQMIRILFFGMLSDAAEPMSCELPAGISTIAELSEWLAKRDSALSKALKNKSNRTALNQVICGKNATVKDGDEIAFMSPLSGG